MFSYFILIIAVGLIGLLRFLEGRKMKDPINHALPFSPTFVMMLVFVILLLDVAYILKNWLGGA